MIIAGKKQFTLFEKSDEKNVIDKTQEIKTKTISWKSSLEISKKITDITKNNENN